MDLPQSATRPTRRRRLSSSTTAATCDSRLDIRTLWTGPATRASRGFFPANKAYKDRPKPDTCSPTLQTLPEFQKRTRRSRTSSRSKCPSETNSPVFVRRARGRVSSSNMGTPRGHVQNPTCRRVLLPRAAVTTDICPSKAQTPSLGALSTTLENSAARVAGAGAVDGAEGDAAEREGSQEQQRAKSVARVSVHVPTAVSTSTGQSFE